LLTSLNAKSDQTTSAPHNRRTMPFLASTVFAVASNSNMLPMPTSIAHRDDQRAGKLIAGHRKPSAEQAQVHAVDKQVCKRNADDNNADQC